MWRGLTGAAAGALLVVGFTSPGQAAAPDACTPGKAMPVRIAGVIDAATFRLEDGRIVSLAGLEAPAQQPAPAGVGDPLAGLPGATVRVAVVGDKPDRYGRWRANVFGADGKWIAPQIVVAGHAVVHRLPGDPQCVLALLDSEREARIGQRGIWSHAAHKIRSASDPSLADETGLYRLVAGRVISIGSGDSMVFVNFGRDYGRDFTVMVTPAMARGLAAAGMDMDSLPGKRVVVRGMIEASGGPAIRLADPADIEVIGDDAE
jgi:endonuclease YncB( thermonuclease family)